MKSSAIIQNFIIIIKKDFLFAFHKSETEHLICMSRNKVEENEIIYFVGEREIV